MATKIQYLTYYIVLTGADAVAAYQAQYPYGVNRAPYNPLDSTTGLPGGAAVEFEAPFKGYGELTSAAAPYIWTPWAKDATSGKPFPLDVATFTRKTGGFWGIGGTTTKYYWIGMFVYATPVQPTVDTVTVPEAVQPIIARRRWVEGFEVPAGGPAAAGVSNGTSVSRDASRHVGGFGLAIRATASMGSATINTDTLIPGLAVDRSWERLYVRLRALPTTTFNFWKLQSNVGSTNAAILAVTPTGQIAVYNVGVTAILLGTVGTLPVWDGTVDDNAWVRLDVRVRMNGLASGDPNPGDGSLTIYRNGVSVGAWTVTDGIGTKHSAGTGAHSSSAVGKVSLVDATVEMDLDDWINADWPTDDGHTEGPGSNLNFTGKDWLNGSKIVLVRPATFGATHDATAWPGDARVLAQNALSGAITSPTLTSTTSGGVIAAVTDADQVVDGERVAIGAAAMVVSVLSSRAGSGAAQGSLGYSLAGGAAVMTALTLESNPGRGYSRVLYSRNSGVAPFTNKTLEDLTPLELFYVKGADANSSTVASLVAQVELLGVFGREDFRDTEAPGGTVPQFPGYLGQHNAPYPRTPWATAPKSAPIAPYIVTGGTYVGNGTGQDLIFRSPIHWFWARPLTGNTGGWQWWSSLLGAHRRHEEGVCPAVPVQDEDLSYVPGLGEDVQQQRYRLRLVGSDTQINALGVTYQYIAVSDPGARFLLNGAFVHGSGTGPDVNPIINASFLAEWAFVFAEGLNGIGTPRHYMKGPGTAADSLGYVAGGMLTDALTFGTGALTSRATLHGTGQGTQIAYSLWRRQDGNNDPGEAAVLIVGTYTGDGTASRTLSLTPTGKRPLFAMLCPETGNTTFRDPSHTGVTSTLAAGTDTSTGITGGGIDSVSLGSTLNSNGVVYNYFVLMAGTTAGNNGWGVNGEYIPVEANSPADGPWPADPPESAFLEAPPAPPAAAPSDPGALSTDIASACVAGSTRLVNLALSRIGISRTIANLGTEASAEAETARTVYKTEIDATLRDFPWPFATRYATLVLVGGTADVAVNGDWQYAYRAPTNAEFIRRIVNPSTKRAFDPNPIPFRMGSDATGDLVFCDEPGTILPTDADVVVEYTHRLDCPASLGDAIFRSAAAWRLAAALAKPLGRDSKDADRCMRNYLLELAKAQIVHANEQQHQDTDGEGDAEWIRARS